VWTCKGVNSGTVFSEVELEEREWTDYDEKVFFLSFWQATWLRLIAGCLASRDHGNSEYVGSRAVTAAFEAVSQMLTTRN
jgi:hypothetical protein